MSNASSGAVTVSIAPDPALVRTVRLVAAAVARRTGADDELVEEVRLAVGEACALLLGEPAGADQAPGEHVRVVMSLDKQLSVEVETNRVAVHDTAHIEPWALLRGLVEDFDLAEDGSRTKVSMSWPAALDG
jgi:hypothetical protein